MPPRKRTPSGIISATMTSATAKQRSARLHLFQSEIQSCILESPGHPVRRGVFITDEREKNSTEVWLCHDEEIVILP